MDPSECASSRLYEPYEVVGKYCSNWAVVEVGLDSEGYVTGRLSRFKSLNVNEAMVYYSLRRNYSLSHEEAIEEMMQRIEVPPLEDIDDIWEKTDKLLEQHTQVLKKEKPSVPYVGYYRTYNWRAAQGRTPDY